MPRVDILQRWRNPSCCGDLRAFFRSLRCQIRCIRCPRGEGILHWRPCAPSREIAVRTNQGRSESARRFVLRNRREANRGNRRSAGQAVASVWHRGGLGLRSPLSSASAWARSSRGGLAEQCGNYRPVPPRYRRARCSVVTRLVEKCRRNAAAKCPRDDSRTPAQRPRRSYPFGEHRRRGSIRRWTTWRCGVIPTCFRRELPKMEAAHPRSPSSSSSEERFHVLGFHDSSTRCTRRSLLWSLAACRRGKRLASDSAREQMCRQELCG